MSDWPDRAKVRAERQREADMLAKRLGHNLVGWLEQDNGRTQRSRCCTCYEAAVITVRRFDAAPFAGAALSLRCRR